MQHLDLKTFIPEKVDSAVILLHGFGAQGDDMAWLVPYFAPAFPTTAFYCPDAPEPVPDYPMGRQWFSLTEELQRLARANLSDFDDMCFSMMTKAKPAVRLIKDLMDKIEATHHIGQDKIILAGFSQGGQLALQTGLTLAPAVAGIISFSGIIGLLEKDEIKSRPPILMTHGTDDATLPFAAHEAAAAVLKSIGADVTDVVLKGEGHTISDEAVAAATGFLQKHLQR